MQEESDAVTADKGQNKKPPCAWYTSLILWWAVVAAAYVTLYTL
jgi:hypothetical protein